MLSNNRGAKTRPRAHGAYRGQSSGTQRGAKRVHWGAGDGDAIAAKPIDSGTSFRGTSTRGASRATSRQPNDVRSNPPGTFHSQIRRQPMAIAKAQGTYQQRHQALKTKREEERVQAIANGLLADPDKPRSLADAITPIGTCQDMCAEFERVERIVQNDVWGAETDPDAPGKNAPDESRMVKKFRRAAAGIDEQLPSDLRPPPVLQQTLDYLFDDLIGQSTSLASIHHFVWDRTRAVRNDFSIQQVSKPADLHIAIDCYERIARFHIMSLHQLALPEKPYDKYDSQQEREQLDKTLLSLMQIYDDSRDRIKAKNEAEFRAYCIIFQIQDPVPDLEDRVQRWPKHILQDGRVQRALRLYAAATNTIDAQGPLKPRAPHPIAQANWRRFWLLLRSNEVSYLMACVAEIYFGLIRRTALNSVWRAYRIGQSQKTVDWTLEELLDVFDFETEDEVRSFCEDYGFTIDRREDNLAFLNLNSVTSKALPEPSSGRHQQRRSELVEAKRHHRTLPAVIRGLSVRAADELGMVEKSSAMDEDLRNDDSLFIKDNDRHESGTRLSPASSLTLPPTNPVLNPFAPSFAPGMTPFQAPLPKLPQIPNTSQQATAHSLEGNAFFPSSNNATTSVLGAGAPGSATTPSESSNPGKPNSSPFTSSIHSASANKPPTLFPTVLPVNPAIVDGKSSFEDQPSPFMFPAQLAKAAPINVSGLPAKSADFVFTPSPIPLGEQNSSTLPSESPTAPVAFPSASTTLSSKATTSQLEQPWNPVLLQPLNDLQYETQSTPPFQFSTMSKSTSPLPLPISSAPSVSNPLTATQLVITPLPRSSELSRASHIVQAQSINPFSTKESLSSDRGSLLSTQPPLISETLSTPFSGANTWQEMKSVHSTNVPPMPTQWQSSPPQSNPSAPGASASADAKRKADEASAARKARSMKTLDRLARTLVEEPQGLFEQFIEFSAAPMIRAAIEEAGLERRTQEADLFRAQSIMLRYGNRWREVCWNRRLLRQGKARRRRLAKGQEARAQQLRKSSAASSVDAFRETYKNCRLGNDIDRADHSMADASVSAKSPSSGSRSAHQHSGFLNVSASVRPFSTVDTANETNGSKSNGVTEFAATLSGPWIGHAESLFDSTSSFGRGSTASLLGSTQRTDTTRSTYFKMKALGLNPTTSSGTKDQPGQEHQSKRLRLSNSTSADQHIDQSMSKADTARRTSLEYTQPMRVTKSVNAEDEELFAAARQIREAMNEGAAFFNDSTTGENSELQPAISDHMNLKTSTASRASFGGSSVREWVAAKLAAPSSSKGKVEPPPSYRNRVSKFLPREHYADVLQHRQQQVTGKRSWPRSKPSTRTKRASSELAITPAVVADNQHQVLENGHDLTNGVNTRQKCSVVHQPRSIRQGDGEMTSSRGNSVKRQPPHHACDDDVADEQGDENETDAESFEGYEDEDPTWQPEEHRAVAKVNQHEKDARNAEDNYEDGDTDGDGEDGEDDPTDGDYENDGYDEDDDEDEDDLDGQQSPSRWNGKGGTSLDDAIEL